MYHLGVSSTAAGDSFQIGRPRFLDRGLHLDFEVHAENETGRNLEYTK